MTVQTTCPYCGVGCGLTVEGSALFGDQSHPANYGRLCSKGAALKDTLSVADRLTVPMLHGRAVDWNEALDYVAQSFKAIRQEHGPDAIAFYVSGQLLTEDYYVANKLMKGFIGSSNIDTNSRLCMSSSVAGHVRAFGEDVVPGCYDDLEEADLVIQVGSNMAWCHPVLYQRLIAAREKRGTTIVTIDPRRTVTAETADLHLPLAQGSDIILFNGLLVYLADRGAIDHAWIADHVNGFDAALEAARHSSPSVEAVATGAGLKPEDVQRFYDLFAQTERVMTLYSQGVNQSVNGSDKVNAILNCHLATGRIGRAGMGPFSLTGQPNAMGGREVGGLANQLASHMAFVPEEIDRVSRFWSAPEIAQKPGFKAVDLFDKVLDGSIKAIWIAATNPADSMPRAGRIRDALKACPLVIVADAWPTDTTALAHVVLPAASWAEKDGTVTNSERRITRQRPFHEAPGEARPDWWMFSEIGRRMGWQPAFGFSKAADVFREHAALSAFENDGRRAFNLGALSELTDANYEAMPPFQWPCTKDGSDEISSQRLYGTGQFSTPDRRARMLPIALQPKDQPPTLSLTLNTGRIRDQWHTMTRTGRVPHLMTHIVGPRLSLHPQDAAARGIADSGLAKVESADGTMTVRILLDPGMRIGDVFLPMHWNDQFSSSGPVGKLVHALSDPVSGQPDLKGTRVDVSAVSESWRGLLLRAGDQRFTFDERIHWSKVPLDAGLMYELSGCTPFTSLLPNEDDVRGFLHCSPNAEIISYADPKRSVFRFASIAEGKVEACLFVATPEAAFSEAERARILLGQSLEPSARISLLAGLEPGVAPRGKTVCSCFSVSETEINNLIRSQQLLTHGQIGAALRAGTNCGSCIPELKKLLAASAADLITEDA
jgi:assimilatory nitrate reductase catalytic subunit